MIRIAGSREVKPASEFLKIHFASTSRKSFDEESLNNLRDELIPRVQRDFTTEDVNRCIYFRLDFNWVGT